MNKEFKILYCENNENDISDFKLYMSNLSRETGCTIHVEGLSFDNTVTTLNGGGVVYDLLLLDYMDKQEEDDKKKTLDPSGNRVLRINNAKCKIPTVIFSGRFSDANGERELTGLQAKYSFILKYIRKGEGSDKEVTDFMREFMSKKGFFELCFAPYDKDDEELETAISNIGLHRLNEIISQFNVLPSGSSVLSFVSGGLSGATVFRLKYNNGKKSTIIKVSFDCEKLKGEYVKAQELFNQFPCYLINSLHPKDYYSLDNKLLGVFIPEVDNARTFLSFLLDTNTKHDAIKSILESIFTNEDALGKHYMVRENPNMKKKWDYIFYDFSKKLFLAKKAYVELQCLIQSENHAFSEQAFDSLIKSNSDNNLAIATCLDESFLTSLTLCHGDLHAKNILIQGKEQIRPILIDTGALGYDYWCTDICFLIVYLFMWGIDADTPQFFDINTISTNSAMLKEIISVTSVTPISKTTTNTNIIYAINWLINNVCIIHPKVFSKFEFQLGLMKQFLKVSSYRDTYPPNKRATALLAAYECKTAANNSIMEFQTNKIRG